MTKAAAPQRRVEPRSTAALFGSAGLDPWQREYELSAAILTLMVACSRYGTSDVKPRETEDRLATLQHVTLLVANEVTERVRNIHGKPAAAAFRKALGRRRQP
jgi:hypothetical protein